MSNAKPQRKTTDFSIRTICANNGSEDNNISNVNNVNNANNINNVNNVNNINNVNRDKRKNIVSKMSNDLLADTSSISSINSELNNVKSDMPIARRDSVQTIVESTSDRVVVDKNMSSILESSVNETTINNKKSLQIQNSTFITDSLNSMMVKRIDINPIINPNIDISQFNAIDSSCFGPNKYEGFLKSFLRPVSFISQQNKQTELNFSSALNMNLELIKNCIATSFLNSAVNNLNALPFVNNIFPFNHTNINNNLFTSNQTSKLNNGVTANQNLIINDQQINLEDHGNSEKDTKSCDYLNSYSNSFLISDQNSYTTDVRAKLNSYLTEINRNAAKPVLKTAHHHLNLNELNVLKVKNRSKKKNSPKYPPKTISKTLNANLISLKFSNQSDNTSNDPSSGDFSLNNLKTFNLKGFNLKQIVNNQPPFSKLPTNKIEDNKSCYENNINVEPSFLFNNRQIPGVIVFNKNDNIIKNENNGNNNNNNHRRKNNNRSSNKNDYKSNNEESSIRKKINSNKHKKTKNSKYNKTNFVNANSISVNKCNNKNYCHSIDDLEENKINDMSSEHNFNENNKRNNQAYKNMTKQRRIEANARERTRVHTISAAFDSLRKAVPSYSHNQRLSKLAILRIACSYILALAKLADLDYSAERSIKRETNEDNCPIEDKAISVDNEDSISGLLDYSVKKDRHESINSAQSRSENYHRTERSDEFDGDDSYDIIRDNFNKRVGYRSGKAGVGGGRKKSYEEKNSISRSMKRSLKRRRCNSEDDDNDDEEESDYDETSLTFTECVELCTQTIQAEGKAKRRN